MENIELIFILLISTNFLTLGLLVFLYIQFNNFKKTNISNAEDVANAFNSMIKYMEKEFGSNFETHQKMQQWHEEVSETYAKSLNKVSDNMYTSQMFLNRLAEFLGYRTRSGIE